MVLARLARLFLGLLSAVVVLQALCLAKIAARSRTLLYVPETSLVRAIEPAGEPGPVESGP